METDLIEKILVTEKVIEDLQSYIRPTSTGHIHTTISTLKMYVSDLEENLSEKERTWLTLKR
jgi:hypothetical protein